MNILRNKIIIVDNELHTNEHGAIGFIYKQNSSMNDNHDPIRQEYLNLFQEAPENALKLEYLTKALTKLETEVKADKHNKDEEISYTPDYLLDLLNEIKQVLSHENNPVSH